MTGPANESCRCFRVSGPGEVGAALDENASIRPTDCSRYVWRVRPPEHTAIAGGQGYWIIVKVRDGTVRDAAARPLSDHSTDLGCWYAALATEA